MVLRHERNVRRAPLAVCAVLRVQRVSNPYPISIGTKMLASKLVHIPTWASLVVIVAALATAVVASLRADQRVGAVEEDMIEEMVERSRDDE